MAYLPKNKYKKKHTNGGEFVIEATGKIYIGPYLELPNRQYYIGENISTLGDKLKPFIPPSTNILRTRQNAIFEILNEEYVKKEKSYKTPISTKPSPTQKDYLRGSMARYFGYRIQTGKYFEIDEKTYTDILSSNNIDKSLYNAGSISWALKGDTEKINGANILRLESRYPGLRKLFVNLSEFGSL